MTGCAQTGGQTGRERETHEDAGRGLLERLAARPLGHRLQPRLTTRREGGIRVEGWWDMVSKRSNRRLDGWVDKWT